MRLPEPFYAWDEHVGIDLAGAQAVFTTRRGGFSEGPYASLNLGRLTDDRPEAVRQNRSRLEEKVGARIAYIRQVHGRPCARSARGPISVSRRYPPRT